MRTGITIAAATVALTSAGAMAQDFTLQPTYGETSLRAGFTPDPFVVQLQSGGAINASQTIGQGCRGYVAEAPDYSIQYTAGSSLPLRIGVSADRDTTLVINGPDGSWHCDDDGGEGLNPLVQFSSPASGRYDIWVGTWGGASNHSANLFITELSSVSASSIGNAQAVSGPNVGLTPGYGTISLRGGFTPDPYRVPLESGGPIRVNDTVSDNGSNAARDRRCRGNIAEAPDVRLNFTPGSLPLIISVASGTDTTLVINGPDGRWYCDDDSGAGTNPSIRWDRPSAGQYDIWVGTYGSTSLRPAELSISELHSE